MQAVGSVLSFSAQPDSTMEISECTPWQYCRIHGLDLLTSSIVTGMREGAGGRQPAAAYIHVHMKDLRCMRLRQRIAVAHTAHKGHVQNMCLVPGIRVEGYFIPGLGGRKLVGVAHSAHTAHTAQHIYTCVHVKGPSC